MTKFHKILAKIVDSSLVVNFSPVANFHQQSLFTKPPHNAFSPCDGPIRLDFSLDSCSAHSTQRSSTTVFTFKERPKNQWGVAAASYQVHPREVNATRMQRQYLLRAGHAWAWPHCRPRLDSRSNMRLKTEVPMDCLTKQNEILSKVWNKKMGSHSKIGHQQKICIFCPIIMKLGENDQLLR